MAISVWFLLFAICCYISSSEAKDQVQYFHYDYNRVEESEQAWNCWKEGYTPAESTSAQFGGSGRGNATEINSIFRFDQSNAVLFAFNSNSDNLNLNTTFQITRNKLVRLLLDNAGLERLEIAFTGRDNDCRLFDLSVPRNRLRELPSGIERLTALRKLDFSYNLLKEFNLDRLVNAPGLKQLLLAHNRLESFVSTVPASFRSLHTLDLSNNRLSTLDSTRWSMPQLATFHVDNNRQLRTIGGWTRTKFPLVKGFDPAGTNNWNQTWLKSVQ